ncbi:vWA domain-containing protein [Sorangium sp. So ce136]|uniref:vWA domain-containing protein n=1 Tax=Sorangium sp. So ce136 TaxID=3133284 RepID=UPI003F114D12
MAGPLTKWMGALSRSGSAEAWAPRALLLVTLLTASAVIAGACSGENSSAPGPQDGTGGPDGGTSTGADAGDPCVDGEERECHITVGEHEGVLTCMDGVRRCVDGRYGSCEGSMTMRRSPFGAAPGGSGESGYRPLANSEASDGGLCATNPCDPTCQSFEEVPDGGPIDLSGAGTTYSWSVGDINELSEPIARQGTHQPCTTAEDCQFDQHCENPASGACAHDICATGTSLLSTCNGCVTKVCDANPNCCTQTMIPADCGHDACQQFPGPATNMTPTCGDACIANICAANPRCCEITCTTSAQCETLIGPTSVCAFGNVCLPPTTTNACPTGTALASDGSCTGTWSAACVNLVATQCGGKTCSTSTPMWNASCVALAESLCDADCAAAPAPGCAHDECYTGPALNPTFCGMCATQVCASMPSCCSSTGQWNEQCVSLAESICGKDCPQQGLCTAYLPNETNPECPGVDLTLGVPCGGTIPVCNRGNTPAPAGIQIHRYPVGAGQLPSSAPGRVLNSCSPTGGTLACTTAQPIAPGECISVAGCTGVTDGMELIINPGGQVAECQCANNGSIYQSAMCESPGCIATASVSLVRPVTMFIALDRSTSMRLAGGVNVNMQRWVPATNALKAFFQDPASAGLGIAFRFWPHANPGPCNDTATGCPGPGGGGCALPLVPFDGLAANRLMEESAAMGDQQELKLMQAFTNFPVPSGDTPMYPALDGATTWAINYKNIHPEEEVAVVLVTDGIPSVCNTVPNDIGELARRAFQDFGVRVHAVGFGNSNEEIINLIAAQGGGQAYNLLAGATLQGGLLNALISIRGEALPCDVTVPLAGVTDPGSVSVVHVNGAGAETTLTPRTGPGNCAGGGWYFADATNTSVKLCPTTCSTIRENPGGKVRAIVPCVTTSLTPITTAWERYQGVCPPGTKTQWGYLRYRTVTPGDSSVEFFVRAADDAADLGAATVTLAATAHATPTNTQVCDETSTPACTVDLFDVLGELPEAQQEFLELQMRLNPTSTGGGGVQVQDWEITYSCPDTE